MRSHRNGVHPTQIAQWKKQALDELPDIFSSQGKREKSDEALIATLYQEIGQLCLLFGQNCLDKEGRLRPSIAAIAPLKRIVSQDGAKNEAEEMTYGMHKLLELEHAASR
jgi:transposase-like protein